jgi:uncharacterized membrane protein
MPSGGIEWLRVRVSELDSVEEDWAGLGGMDPIGRKTPLQVAALSAALLMAFELALIHWAALYIAWFFPFVALAVLAGTELGGEVPARSAAHARLEPEPRTQPHPSGAPA